MFTTVFPLAYDTVILFYLADNSAESISLVINGPLEGKYVLLRFKDLVQDYLKKCSSVLGISAIISRNIELLISDKLSPEVLISPNGAYEAFKKGFTTVCKGLEVGV